MVEANAETAKREAELEEIQRTGVFFSPVGIGMLAVAALIDGGEFLIEHIPYVGQVLSILLDIFAVFFFGLWMWIRSGTKRTVPVPKKAKARITKAMRWARRLRWLRPLCFIIELIPIGSSYLPLWILVVLLELRYS